MTTYHKWEYVFFAGLFSAVILYPFVSVDVPALADGGVFVLLGAAGLAVFITTALCFEFYERRRVVWLVLGAVAAACAGILVGGAGTAISPPLTVWFIGVTLALFSFGYFATRHLFRRVERDFRSHWRSVITVSFCLTVLTLIGTTMAATFPPILVALTAAGLVLASATIK